MYEWLVNIPEDRLQKNFKPEKLNIFKKFKHGTHVTEKD